ncbi:endochitinase precursor [Drechmeria coniospora]|uniref:chitinase n=1 Tax=Drechmeria coniospora TaxID=98403 RepID=A0A151GLE4_DRECN|nr:endochitinase precursor [Drechmeria coniospora]KYK57920.1 endochitinase precursor [Drechmeria coniospora]
MPSMLLKSFTLALAASLASLGLAAPNPVDTASAAGAAADAYSNAVFFSNRGIYKQKYQPQDLPLSDITHVFYSFVGVLSNGTVVSVDRHADLQKKYLHHAWERSGTNAYGCVKELYLLKKHNRMTKTILSVGGWGSSRIFRAVAATKTGRDVFAKSAVEFMKDWGFDGIDIDWKYAENAKEADDMLLLLHAIRDEMDRYAVKFAAGHHFELSMAAPAGADKYKHYRLGELGQLVDRINLIAYDFAGIWSKTSGHQANLHADGKQAASASVEGAVRHYLDAGVPSSKMHLGMPTYGRSFEATSGIGMPFTGVGKGSWEPGMWDYKVLPKSGATVRFDNVSMAAYSYDAATNELISFDTTQTVEGKVAYLKSKGLGGSMFWEASADRKGNSSLVGASHRALGRLDTSQNWLEYPDSKYDNIRNGMRDQPAWQLRQVGA